jgi:hypothetical protein
MNMATSAKAKASKPTRATNGRPAAKGAMLPYTGKEFLDSLDDGREVWLRDQLLRQS